MHLARALAIDPELLLLEHPTVDLPRSDVPAFSRTVRLVSERRGLTVIAISLDADFSSVVAQRRLQLQPATGALVDARGWWSRVTGR